MKATVYYIDNMSDEFYKTVNEYGWDCDLGRKYHAAQKGEVSYEDPIYVKAAETSAYNGAEDIWSALQNVGLPWNERQEVKPFLTRPRSMDIGDIIVWANGRKEIVDYVGFKEI